MITKAKRYLYLTTPYLVIDETITAALCTAARSGVDVRILTPHIPDKKVVFAVTQSNYPVLLEAGVRIYEFTPGFLHSQDGGGRRPVRLRWAAATWTTAASTSSLKTACGCAGTRRCLPCGTISSSPWRLSQEITLDDGRTLSLFQRLLPEHLPAVFPLF